MKELPPLELRTAYTNKGFGIGAGAFLGLVAAGPFGALVGAWTGWFIGNNMAIKAEREYSKT